MSVIPSPTPIGKAPSLALRSRSLVLCLTAAAAVGVALKGGYQTLTARPGEAALSCLVPDTALAVLSLDARPSSWTQWKTARRLQAAASSENLPPMMDDADQAMQKIPLFREVKPYWSGGAAACVWGRGSRNEVPAWENAARALDQYEGLIIFSVNDPARVAEIIEKEAVHVGSRDGLKIVRLRTSGSRYSAAPDLYAAVIGSYLVLAPSQRCLETARDVNAGKTPSIVRQKEWSALRQTLPSDANVIAYASPDAIKRVSDTGDTRRVWGGVDSLRRTQGAAFAATLQENGINLSTAVGSDVRLLEPLEKIAPLDADMFRRLPDGAIAASVMSQPSRWYDVTENIIDDMDRYTRDSWSNNKDDLERRADISVSKDVLPAFDGQIVMALYPGEQSDLPVEGLLIIDDTHDANPARLAERLRDWAERSDRQVHFESDDRNGATFWELPEQNNQEILRNAFGSAAVRNKRRKLEYAQVGKAVLIASNTDLLEKATRAYAARKGSAFASAVLPPGTQNAVVFSPTKQEARDLLNRWNVQNRNNRAEEMEEMMDAVLDTVQDTPFFVSTRYQNKILAASVFLPMNPERGVHAAALIMKHLKTTDRPQAPYEGSSLRERPVSASAADSGMFRAAAPEPVTNSAPVPAQTTLSAPAPYHAASAASNEQAASNLEDAMKVRLLTQADLQGKTAWDLDVLRNTAYARRGYIFDPQKRPDLVNYFAGQSWYRPVTADDTKVHEALSATEKANVIFIRTYEAAHGMLKTAKKP